MSWIGWLLVIVLGIALGIALTFLGLLGALGEFMRRMLNR